ncbi:MULTISPECIES: coproporphyrinogen dehydrogenase HemZ [Romboutsia]|uniref:Oxygen-independent coproporphyrinogen-III oxidase 2 n=1 Tax=Romboutsia hominis TaxID=1507512 RepID=A0A2P2BU87_9FIRM|nr:MULTISPECIES: coproporphyrinogen dehydrogenase HemZ [Romboutsia]MDB8789624.1 coproporphyrinogen dehydrogenase HemZ [Romboutsia sp. 1001216sp1]MDB8793770.1 coproporphyrinogen dehydrogenase HemZ [Romboutsia sp. 1001216sp1]MDB8797560.1 coproporphyrinogen dehydrogenase HemZ [Romboutsia sp. 1001216sp1]MDB8799976.1 coproporphyrinogen dehydrogenase HemZ [Romboutsia sp. 1001216sp1]MDB8802777.1 coproporphyrinogen dehydrogenase HemZ [Romboutsia sp. 1001216sp1]
MIGVVLKGHDYKYEVAELIKLFTTDFEFVERKSFGRILTNTLLKYNDTIIAKTEYYENYDLKYEFRDHINISGLNEQEIKKATKETIKRSIFKVLKNRLNSYVPWGILTGIRPVKIVHTLLDQGVDEESIRKILKEKYYIMDEKIDLSLEIAKRERIFIYPIDKNKISLYVGIPFCPTRCYYCSFPANPLKQFGHLRKEYVDKLIEEIKGLSKILKDTNKEIETLYIGGGTPTALEKEELDTLITALFKELDLSTIKEFTVEAGRPDTITREKLEVLKKHNVDRISINPQTMNDETLAKIGRDHTVADIVDCFNMARAIGFDNINMDIILGLVDEDLDMVRNTLEEIKKLSPESLTVHTLAVKRASNLKENLDKYELTRYEEMIKMIDLSMEYARDMGLNPYYMYRQKHMLGNLENIGYAKEGYECIYNIQIMEEKQSNYAVGAGSISKFVYVDEDRIERVDNVKNVEQYIDRVDEMIERKRKEIYKNVN